jgi:ABC-2 type transport system permease protein
MKSIITVAVKEIRTYFSTPAAYIILILFLSLTGWFFTNTLFIDGGRAELSSNFDLIPFLYLFFVPALTMKMIAEERKSGTIELLTTLPLTGTRIVLGKFAGSLTILLLAVLLTFPNILTILILGSPDTGVLLSGYAGLVLTGACFVSIGIYASSVTESQIVAFLLCFFILFFLLMVGNLLVFLPFQAFFNYIGTVSHYQNMLKGIIDTRDLVYFLSLTVLFLAAASESVDSKRN